MNATRASALGVLLSALLLGAPTAAAAHAAPTGSGGSGGSGLTGGSGPSSTGSTSGGSTSSSTSTAPLPPTAPAQTPVSASGSGLTLETISTAVLRRSITFTGTAPASTAGETVVIERSGHQTNWRWTPTATGTIADDGSFTVTWTTNHIGRFAIRAILATPERAQAATAGSSSDATTALTVTVYRPSRATLYGPGFYGHRTACGQRLRAGTIGVASRTLKCGTSVAILYDGRTLVVPVIDRGPYANGADWDLTMATGRALGLTGTAQIAAVSLPTR